MHRDSAIDPGEFDKAEGRHDGSGQSDQHGRIGTSHRNHVPPSPRRRKLMRFLDKAILNWY